MQQQPTSTSTPDEFGAAGLADAELVFLLRMKRERHRLGWSQARLAEEANKHLGEGTPKLHPTAITKLEWVTRIAETALEGDRDSLRRDPKGRALRVNEAFALSAALGLSLTAMLSDDDLSSTRREYERLAAEIETAQAELVGTRTKMHGAEQRLAELHQRMFELSNSSEEVEDILDAEHELREGRRGQGKAKA